MEKDKVRSAITVGMLAGSLLLMLVLFSGCSSIAQLVCPHHHQAAYYHHANSIPPHIPGYDTLYWYVGPPPLDSLGKPMDQPCPVDGQMCGCDSIKCTDCGKKLWQP